MVAHLERLINPNTFYCIMHQNELTIQYIAGFFDGEGTIGVSLEHGKYHTLRIYMGNTDEQIIRDIKNFFGIGGIYITTSKLSTKPFYIWCIHAKTGSKILENLLPYLHVKKERAMLALELSKRMENKIITESEFAEREKIRFKIKSLNKQPIKKLVN